MKKIFKNMIPYWKTILVIVAVLVLQAYCDLALPTYTADIIDVGIQNKGIEYSLPEEITAEEYEDAQLFMTKEEKTLWASSYEATQQETYERSVTDKETLGELDSEFGADWPDDGNRVESIRKRSGTGGWKYTDGNLCGYPSDV